MTTGVDTEEMLLIHRVIRRELGLAPRLVRGAAGDPARSQRVSAHLTEMLYFLHTHHSGEDELLWPVLRPRAALEQDLIDRMEAQHEQVAAAITAIEADLPGWTVSADRETGERIAAAIEAMTAVLRGHLAEEEERILPLVSELFSQAEWDKLGEHGFGSVPPRRRLVVLGAILDEATPQERSRFMQKVPPPARLLYKLIGRRQYEKEAAGIRSLA
jgi:hemerythrin-like domain-containing protein